MTDSGTAPYDALLLVSFGGPEKPDDVLPFLENVTRGRQVPRERLEQVAQHYQLFGGRSPLNDLNRGFLAAVEEDLRGNGVSLPVYWGNRNWDPYLTDAMGQMAKDGVERAVCFFTSAYSSYSGCRQYREDLAAAVADVDNAPQLNRVRHYFNHPGFVEPIVDATLAALAELPADARGDARLLYTTHSIPVAMNDASGAGGSRAQTGSDGAGGAYVAQHETVAAEVTERIRQHTGHRFAGELVYCSRSGPAEVPWLGPDVSDRIASVARHGVAAVIVVPIGFVADHMEVVYDLDTEARAAAEQAGVAFARAATPGVDPRFVALVRDLVLERAAAERGDSPGRAAVGTLAPSWDVCPIGCCANPRGPRAALCGRG